MPNVLVNALEINNFRGFKHLKLDKLGRVNLIVGKNNVGKTSLLEALAMYARRGSPALIWDILEARHESARIRGVARNTTDIQNRIEDVRFLFYGRQDIKEKPSTISVGTGLPHETLSISTGWYALQTDNQGLRKLQPLLAPEFAAADNVVLGLSVRHGSDLDTVYRLYRYVDFRRPPLTETSGIKYIYVPANGLGDVEVGEYWDSITLTVLLFAGILPGFSCAVADLFE